MPKAHSSVILFVLVLCSFVFIYFTSPYGITTRIYLYHFFFSQHYFKEFLNM